ncbi:MAG: hypothetical protein U0R64_07815 [Candidatus Nanopelagicales bacterium]
MFHHHSPRLAAGAGVAALLAASLGVVGVTSAQADDVNPSNATPTVAIDTDTLSMAPDNGVGDNIYTVAVTVGDANSLEDLNTVTLCLYSTADGDATCTNQDARNTALITWTRSGDTFDIDATSGTEASNWELGTGGDSEASTNNASYSYSGYVATDVSMQILYRFRVSDATRQGAWSVRAVANDGDATQTANDTTGYSASWYGRVATQRAGYNWGDVASGSSATADNLSAGTVVANGGSDIQMATTSFFNGTTTISNAGGTTNTSVSADRQFAIDVDPGVSYDGTGTGRLTGSLADVETGDLLTGTTEAGDTSSTQSFKLWLGNKAPRAASPYSGTVTVGVTED